MRFDGQKLFYDIGLVVLALLPGGIAAGWAHQKGIYKQCLRQEAVWKNGVGTFQCVGNGYTLASVGEFVVLIMMISAAFWVAIMLLYLLGRGLFERYVTVQTRGDSGG